MPNKLRDYLQLVRAPAVFTAFSNILAAHLIATQGQIQWSSLVLSLAASSSLYIAGMVLNDCFDFAEDRRERPNRPLPSGRIPIRSAWRLGWILLALGLGFSSLVGLRQLAIALILAGFIVAYNAFAKKYLIGPLFMGGCRYLNWLLGLSIVPLQQAHFILALPIFVYVASLTLLSRMETTANNRAYLAFSFVGMLICASLMMSLQWAKTGLSSPFSLFLLLAALAIFNRMLATYRDFTPPQIQKTIKTLVIGIIPLDALITLSNASIWGAIMVILLWLPGWLLARSMRVT